MKLLHFETLFIMILSIHPTLAQEQKVSPLEQPKGKIERKATLDPMTKTKIIFGRSIRKKIEHCTSDIAVLDEKSNSNLETLLRFHDEKHKSNSSQLDDSNI